MISFNIKNIHPLDVSTMLDMANICVRAGNHCAQPLMRYLGIDSTVRISFALYNDKSDVDRFILQIKNIYEKFKKYIEG